MEMEDDLFFADLSKQISLLIMDDEDDDSALALPPPWPSYPPLQDLYGVTASVPRQQQWQEKNHQETRGIMSKGTGVFIPRFAQPRRKRGANNHNHSTRHTSSFSNNNYARSNQNYKQKQQDYGKTRLPQEDSKTNYFINHPNKL